MKRATWPRTIVIVPKKNGKISVCFDYRNLNVVTIIDALPLPFVDNVLDTVGGHEMYSLLDGFIGYNQVRMHPDDQEKTTIIPAPPAFPFERQVQHRPDRLKKLRTGSVGTDRLGQGPIG